MTLLAQTSLASQSVSFAATEKTFRDRCNAFDTATVDSMVAKINASLERRDNAANNGGGSYTKERAKVVANIGAVARFFLALNIEPSQVIERRVVASAMFNAKALKKVVELARFAVTGNKSIEKVMSAFIICALAFENRTDGAAISNRINKSFLSNLDFSKIVEDEELADYLADYQHAYISGGKDTQSSQARNVLDVLGLGEIVNCDNRSRGGIVLNNTHAFFADFCEAFIK